SSKTSASASSNRASSRLPAPPKALRHPHRPRNPRISPDQVTGIEQSAGIGGGGHELADAGSAARRHPETGIAACVLAGENNWRDGHGGPLRAGGLIVRQRPVMAAASISNPGPDWHIWGPATTTV